MLKFLRVCCALLLATARLTATDAPTRPPSPTSPADARYTAVQAELLAMLEADQVGRRRLDAVEKQHGRDSAEMQRLWAEIDATDDANLKKLDTLLAQHGWLGPKEVGARASAGIFFVIQHADLDAQKKYLPLMRDAVKSGRAPAASLALLEDRVALREGRPQTYGSQIGFDEATGTHYVLPLAEPARVDERRAAVGLPPLADYVKQWHIVWDVADYERRLPTLKNTFLP